MFTFEKEKTYQMPVHFGPSCGPRSGPDGKRLYHAGAQESTLHSLVYEASPEAIERYLPEGFSLRMPYIIATHKMHRNLPWLAGRGYNVVTFNTPVTYQAKDRVVKGQYQLAIWENHADPIISGREQIGYSKVYAAIEDLHTLQGVARASLSSWDFRFLTMSFDTKKAPEDSAALEAVLDDPENEGLMHLKYIPHSEAPFDAPDVCCVTMTPRTFPVPEDASPLPPATHALCSGALAWYTPTWEDMPTQYHIVRGLSAITPLRYAGARITHSRHYNDVYHQVVL